MMQFGEKDFAEKKIAFQVFQLFFWGFHLSLSMPLQKGEIVAYDEAEKYAKLRHKPNGPRAGVPQQLADD